MKPSAFCICLGFSLIADVGLRGGDLNPPPGPIGPTMKRLDEVEPRTPISSLPYTIAESGSYYLTGNLTGVAGQNGITVAASDVSIDLMGFTLYGVPGSLDGIGSSMLPIAFSNLSMRNGTIRDWGGTGIMASSLSYGRPDHILVRNNGGDGIVLGDYGICENCTAQGNAGRGIVADKSDPQLYKAMSVGNGGDGIVLGENGTCENCTASGNSGRGIVADKSSPKLFGCSAVGNPGGDGIVLGDGGIAENCTSRGNGGNGIMCPYVASWNGAIAEGNTLDGFVVGAGSTLTDCQALNNGGNGLRVVDNNSPPRTSTTLFRGCVARGNSNMGFKLNLALVAQASAGAIDGPASAPAARQSVAQGNGSDRFSVGSGSALEGRMAGDNRGNRIGLAIPFDWGLSLFACIAEGNASDGFSVGGGSVLEGCIARNNGGIGVNSTEYYQLTYVISEGNTSHGFSVGGGIVRNCVARNNGGIGVTSIDRDRDNDIVVGTLAEGNALDGIVVGPGSEVRNCTSRNNGGNGLRADRDGDGVIETTAEGNGLNGIVVGSSSEVRNCTARNNGSLGAPGGGAGILVTGEANRIEANDCSKNIRGIAVDGAGNIVVKNTAMNNSVANYDIATGNSYGPILNVGAGGDLSALSGGDQPTANLSLTCPTWCRDADADGYGDPAGTQQTCAQPSGHVSDCSDCNDANNAINPGATEVCNGVDDDCDKVIDEGCPPP